MADKELWKTAYDAHWSWYDEVSERPKRWETDADECDAAAFQASAEAVVQAWAAEPLNNVRLRQQAVIEAARDWLHGKSGTFAEETALVYAVRALDALEVE